MERIYNGLFEYPGNWGGMTIGTTHCWLQVFTHAYRPTVVVATERESHTGLSVTNGIERIANGVCRQFNIPPGDLILIDHFGRISKGHVRALFPEAFSRVDFKIEDGMLYAPQWVTISRADLDALIGQLFEAPVG